MKAIIGWDEGTSSPVAGSPFTRRGRGSSHGARTMDVDMSRGREDGRE